MEYVVINEKDNVKVSLSDGHKYAVKEIKKENRSSSTVFPSALQPAISKSEKRCTATT